MIENNLLTTDPSCGIVWQDFLTQQEISQIHKLADQYKEKFTAPAQVGLKSNVNPAARRSTVIWIGNNADTAWLYNKIAKTVTNINNEVYKFELVDGSALQYTIYFDTDAGHYDWHSDSLLLDNGHVRKLSLSILLSDPAEFKGGAFLFAPDGHPVEIEQVQGRMIVFPSWVPHKVMPVLKGTRVSLVLWVHGKPFK